MPNPLGGEVEILRVGEDREGRTFAALRYLGGPFPDLPWTDEPFDAVVITDQVLPPEQMAALSRAIASANIDWVATAGANAEALHDAIDNASVLIGRQVAAGDGSPMTSWHEAATTTESYAELPFVTGGEDRILLVFAGSSLAFEDFILKVRRRLTRPCS